MMIFTK